MNIAKPFYLILLIVWLAACSDNPESIEKLKVYSFGTWVEISYWGADQSQIKSINQQIEQKLNYMHDTWHAWHPSTLGKINQAIANGQSITISADMQALISKGQSYYQQSNGLFNPAISKLIGLWGFHHDNPQENKTLPGDRVIQQLLQGQPSMDDLKINLNVLSSSNPNVKLDFGGFAKGFGIAKLAELLKQNHIQNALINAGGDVYAIGSHPDRDWQVAVIDPQSKKALAKIVLKSGEAAFTSGTYERFFTVNGKQYSHIIDPRTGYPTQGTTSVTILHHDATLADAAATALLVAGKDEWQPIAKQWQLDYVLLIDAQNQYHMTDAMKKRLSFINHSQEKHDVNKLKR